MDINVTGQIGTSLGYSDPVLAAIISIGAGLIGGLVTGGITLIGVWMTLQHEKCKDEQRHEQEITQKQWELFSKLKGIQAILPQDYIDHYSSIVLNIGHEAAARLHSEKENQSLHLEEAKRLGVNLLESSRQFAKDRQELYELIGSIMILFPNSQELHEKINPIYSQITAFEPEFTKKKLTKDLELLIPHINDDLNTWYGIFDEAKAGEYFKTLEDWRGNKITRIRSLAYETIFRQLDGLLNHLLTEIHREDESIEH